MVKEHDCQVLNAAERFSGNAVDCARKSECNKGTACVLVREYSSWEALLKYFINIANETARLEEDFLKGLETR